MLSLHIIEDVLLYLSASIAASSSAISKLLYVDTAAATPAALAISSSQPIMGNASGIMSIGSII
jgi:hypothetical protein